MRLWINAAVVGLMLLAANRLIAQEVASKESSTKVIVTISVDWEGMSLSDSNLKAFAEFRERFPKIPLTHFLNAAYYCREESAKSVTEKIRRAIRKGDETGLHIHCWRSLVEKAGVTYKNQPTFWGDNIPVRKNRNGDEGHEVELAAYSAEEVEKLANKSREILKENGFEISKSFRAAGWVASKDVLQGIRKAGFTIDSSATDRTWHQNEIAKFKIYERMGELWPKVTQHTQPYKIKTSAGDLLEMPDTGALADYITADEMDLHLKEVLKKAETGGTRYLHIGFHQETAARYVNRVAHSIAKWEGNQAIQFQTLEKAAQSFSKQKSKTGKK